MTPVSRQNYVKELLAAELEGLYERRGQILVDQKKVSDELGRLERRLHETEMAIRDIQAAQGGVGP